MSRGPVANQFPTRASAYKLAFIGEAPGAEEVRLGYPFAGAAGFLLNGVLSSIGLSREECFVGNVCQFKPSITSNEFHLLDWNGDEVQAGIVQLSADLASFQPCIVVALGNVPLHLFRHGNVAPARTATGYKWLSKITNWRGSLFLSHETLSSPSPVSSNAPCVKSLGSSVNQAASAQDVIDGNSNVAAVQAVTVGRDPHRITTTVPLQVLIDNLRDPDHMQRMGWKVEEGIAAAAAACQRYKVLPTWHPAYVLRVYSRLFDLRQDLRKARDEGTDPVLELPRFDIQWGPGVAAVDATTQLPLPLSEVLDRLHRIKTERPVIALDTEGQEWCTCIGFATSPTNAFVVDTLGLKGQPHAAGVWQAIRDVLEDPAIRKVCWAAGHELGFLQWCHGIHCRGLEDAMFLWAERWPELAKGLKYAASLLTRIACWTEGISWSEDSDIPQASGPLLWRYNAHDCLATFQLYQHPQLQLLGRQRERYEFNLALLEPVNYASQKGIHYDQEAAETLRNQLTPQMWEAQAEVDQLAGIKVPSAEEFLDYLRSHCCAKLAVKKGLVKDFKSAARHALKKYRKELLEVQPLYARGDAAAFGELAAVTGFGLNVKSTKQVTKALNKLGLPPVYKPGKRKVSTDNPDAEPAAPSQSKDQEALLKLFLRTGHPITTAILKTVALRGRLQELDRKIGSDGRIRCSFTVGYGTETGRTTSHAWLDGSGGNLTTVPKEPVNFRILYAADPGHLFWKLDLTGADLWTVACRVASLGDRTMLDDLLAGIRIPSLVGLLMEGYQTRGVDRATIKSDCVAYRAKLKTDGRGWMDTLWKKASHLTNYGGKPPRIRQGVIEDSYAETGTPVDPGLALCQQVQRLYLARYWGLPKWWSDTAGKIVRTGRLEMATGQVREFLSRRPHHGKLDDATLRQALAAEPQSVTTHVCNLALHKLWYDLENWPSGTISYGDPAIQPLIFVHDEIVGQFHLGQREFLCKKLRAAFDNDITIGHVTIKIPFAGGTGLNWGTCSDPI